MKHSQILRENMINKLKTKNWHPPNMPSKHNCFIITLCGLDNLFSVNVDILDRQVRTQIFATSHALQVRCFSPLSLPFKLYLRQCWPQVWVDYRA